MSRIADAQKKAGVVVGMDAELAWTNAQAATQGPSPSVEGAEPPLPWQIPDDVSSPTAGERAPFAPVLFEHDAQPATELAITDAGARDELSMLVRRLFAAAPVGEGIRTVMFYAAEGADSSVVVQAIARRLAHDRPSARIAVMRIADGRLPQPLDCGSPVQMCAGTPVEARLRAEELAALFEFVLFDARVTGADPDVLALARNVEGVVLVIAENATRREAARSLNATLQDSNARVLGAVLCNCTYPIPQRIYERL